jgi:hypothetical protein
MTTVRRIEFCIPALCGAESRKDANLSEQGGKIVVETLAGHQAVAERYDDRERQVDGPARRRAIEKPATVDPLIPRLGDHEGALFRPVAPLAPYLEIEGIPPEPIISFRSGVPAIGFPQRQILEQAVVMEFRERLLHSVPLLGRQMPIDDGFRRLVHRNAPCLLAIPSG